MIIIFNKRYLSCLHIQLENKQKKVSIIIIIASFINNNDIPGVGAYDCTAVNISKVTRGPTFVIGRSTRIKTDKSHGPGPTSYNIINQSMFVINLLILKMEKNKGCQITGKIR